jgi:hypothetical protein
MANKYSTSGWSDIWFSSSDARCTAFISYEWISENVFFLVMGRIF